MEKNRSFYSHIIENKEQEEKKSHDFAVAILNFDKEINVGGVVRLANATAAREIIIVGRKDWTKSPAAHAQAYTRIIRKVTTNDLLKYAQDENYNIVSIEITPNAKNIFSCTYPPRPLFIFGNEGRGIPKEILNKSKLILRIPQFGQIESLNVASSAAIVMYDWIRKHGREDLQQEIEKTKYVPRNR
jgi:tRNA G18 (ribose-2'-O)-methylase SpoU